MNGEYAATVANNGWLCSWINRRVSPNSHIMVFEFDGTSEGWERRIRCMSASEQVMEYAHSEKERLRCHEKSA